MRGTIRYPLHSASVSVRRFPLRIGLVGTGFIALGFLAAASAAGFRIKSILTRRPIETVSGISSELLTRDDEVMIRNSDIVVECSGDAVHATAVIDKALAAGRPVVTMNSEFHVTTGSWFHGRGLLTEAEGDQSGSLAAFREEAEAMGFRPLVYGNIKRYLNLSPTPEDMRMWAERQGVGLEQVTAFTDGTKVQIEQALVANGLACGIAREGLLGPRADTLREGAEILARAAAEKGRPVSDYVITPEYPGGIFIVAEHDQVHASALNYFKLGAGPHYLLIRPYHLCYLEMAKTIRRIMDGGGVLLDNGRTPSYSVAAVAKRDLHPGDRIRRALGSFDVRGECVAIRNRVGHVPVGLLQDAVIERHVPAGEIISMGDVSLPDTLALHAWRSIEQRVLAAGRPHPLSRVSAAAV